MVASEFKAAGQVEDEQGFFFDALSGIRTGDNVTLVATVNAFVQASRKDDVLWQKRFAVSRTLRDLQYAGFEKDGYVLPEFMAGKSAGELVFDFGQDLSQDLSKGDFRFSESELCRAFIAYTLLHLEQGPDASWPWESKVYADLHVKMVAFGPHAGVKDAPSAAP